MEQQRMIADQAAEIERLSAEVAALRDGFATLAKKLNTLNTAHEDLENAFIRKAESISSALETINNKPNAGETTQNRIKALRAILASGGAMMVKDVRKMLNISPAQMSKLIAAAGDDIIVEQSRTKKNAKVIRLATSFRKQETRLARST